MRAFSSVSSGSTVASTICCRRMRSTLCCIWSSPISSSASKLSAPDLRVSPEIACANSASSACGYASHSAFSCFMRVRAASMSSLRSRSSRVLAAWWGIDATALRTSRCISVLPWAAASFMQARYNA